MGSGRRRSERYLVIQKASLIHPISIPELTGRSPCAHLRSPWKAGCFAGFRKKALMLGRASGGVFLVGEHDHAQLCFDKKGAGMLQICN
jgi:hypothetical protein